MPQGGSRGGQPIDPRTVANVAAMLHRGMRPADVVAEISVSLPTVYAIRDGTHVYQRDGTVIFDEDDPNLEYWRVSPGTLKRLIEKDLVESYYPAAQTVIMKTGRNLVQQSTDEDATAEELAEIRRIRYTRLAAKRQRGTMNVRHGRERRLLGLKQTERKQAAKAENVSRLATLKREYEMAQESLKQEVEQLEFQLGEEREELALKQSQEIEEFEQAIEGKQTEQALLMDQSAQRRERIRELGPAHADCECHPYVLGETGVLA